MVKVCKHFGVSLSEVVISGGNLLKLKLCCSSSVNFFVIVGHFQGLRYEIMDYDNMKLHTYVSVYSEFWFIMVI